MGQMRERKGEAEQRGAADEEAVLAAAARAPAAP
jgi:hypothetical protein